MRFSEVVAKFIQEKKSNVVTSQQRAKLPMGKVIYPAKTRRNNRETVCDYPDCETVCKVNEGFIQLEEVDGKNVWKVYCAVHAGTKSVVEAPRAFNVLTEEGELYVPYDPTKLAIYRSFPGTGRFDGEKKCWHVSLKMEDRSRVLELADGLGIEVAPGLRVVPKSDKVMNAVAEGLYPYQVQGISWLSAREKTALLGDDMGLGKTVQTIKSWNDDDAVLVICPKIVKYNWQREIKKWRPKFNAYVISKSSMFSLPLPGDVNIINFDMLPSWLSLKETEVDGEKKRELIVPPEFSEDLKRVTVVWDEAHSLSNWKTQRSSRAYQLNRQVKKVVGLTGTPLMNRPEQLMGLLMSLNMFYEVFKSPTHFRMLFNGMKDEVRNKKTKKTISLWRYGMPKPEVAGLLRRVMLRRTRQEVMPDLPTKTYQTLYLEDLSTSIQRELNGIWEEYQQSEEFSSNKLPPFEKMSEVRAKLAEERIPAMLEYVEDIENNDVPLVVASAHRSPIDALAKREGWFTITGDTSEYDRNEYARLFQQGYYLNRGEKCPVKGIGLTIRAGGVGINLFRAWLMLFVDRDWSPGLNDQMECRIVRIGQTADNVQIVQMTSRHPLEIHILKLLGKKQRMIHAAIEQDVI